MDSPRIRPNSPFLHVPYDNSSDFWMPPSTPITPEPWTPAPLEDTGSSGPYRTSSNDINTNSPMPPNSSASPPLQTWARETWIREQWTPPERWTPGPRASIESSPQPPASIEYTPRSPCSTATLRSVLDGKLADAMEEVKRQANEELAQARWIMSSLGKQKEQERLEKSLWGRFPNLYGDMIITTSAKRSAVRQLHASAVGAWALRREIAIMRDYRVMTLAIDKGEIADLVDLVALKLGGEPADVPRLEDSVVH